MLRLCFSLTVVVALALASPAAGQDAAVPGVPLEEESALPDEQTGTSDIEAPAEDPEAGERSPGDGGSTESNAAPEVRAAQAEDRNCPDFDFQEDAQEYFEENGGSAENNVDELDADGDGEACESLPSRDDGDIADGDDAVPPRGGIDTGLGGTARERDLSVLAPLGLCLLAVSGGLALWHRRSRHKPTR